MKHEADLRKRMQSLAEDLDHHDYGRACLQDACVQCLAADAIRAVLKGGADFQDATAETVAWLAGFRVHRDGDLTCPHGYGKGDHHWESGDCLALNRGDL